MTVIVTGAAEGIGRSIADLLLARGQRVVAVDRNTSLLRASTANSHLTIVEGDICHETTLMQACDAAGTVTGLVATEGISMQGSSRDYPVDEWDRITGVNLTAAFLAMRIAAPYASIGASFVAISSSLGLHSGRADYPASKARFEGSIRKFACELAPNIRVNAVTPGYIKSEMVERSHPESISESEILARTPLGRWGVPADVAKAINFLLTGASSWITGITLPVDGGWTSTGSD